MKIGALEVRTYYQPEDGYGPRVRYSRLYLHRTSDGVVDGKLYTPPTAHTILAYEWWRNDMMTKGRFRPADLKLTFVPRMNR